jgi:NAD+ diphosphatase
VVSGSPINRVSFLRDDYTFLAGAFSHPSARFLVFKTLSPVIKSPTEIHFATLDDLKPLFPSNPFDKPEKELVEEFDSRIDHPQLVFLGLDENVKDGYSYRNFTGAPHWAVDITPKKTFEKEANELAEKFTSSGLKFSEGMRAMSFPADVGESASILSLPMLTV